jgi:formylglycine-generating enzyme required for sulfatase activity
VAYCKWLRGRTGKRYRLPSEAEWEKAARGPQGGPAIYPWGDAWQAGRCHIAPDTAPVSQYPAQNDYGCFDLVGNAWEWTCTLVGSEASWQDAKIGAEARNVLEPGQPGGPDSAGGSLYFVLRGGSRLDGPEQLRCSARDLDNWQERSQKTGFRVVMDLSKHS